MLLYNMNTTQPKYCKNCMDEIEFDPNSSVVKANSITNVHWIEWEKKY